MGNDLLDNGEKSSASSGGYTDSHGEWRPENPVSFAPVFIWPPNLKKFSVWLYNYLFTWNLVYLAIVIFSYYFLQPPIEEMKTFKFSWILTIFLRNMALVWLIYGGWHLYLYKLKLRGNRAKYCSRWQSRTGSTFLWNDQVYDNIFWTCASAVPIWTAYEILTFWLYANQKIPYLDPRVHPVYFILLFLIVPFWREFHFYLIHRLIHWKPLYNKIHYLHHYNINPGPWSGLSMHPVEHLLYFSVVLIHYIVPSHPLHFLFNSQHTALTPAPGHTGFEGKLFNYLPFGSYFHYLHHRFFDCNYGESTIPMDKWFGVFEDGSQTPGEKQLAASAYHKLLVTKIVDESTEVKSFYLSSADHTEIKSNIPGQHLTFKIPFHEGQFCGDITKKDRSQIKYLLRSYTISNNAEENQYRISVKNEPGGQVSKALHSTLKPGDTLEARGPKGTFIYLPAKGKPDVFIAAGIGITPILSMLKSPHKTAEDKYLILAVREINLLNFQEEISQLCRSNRKIKVHVFFSREPLPDKTHLDKTWECHSGRVDIESLKSILPPKSSFNFYICGPEEMTNALVGDIFDWMGKSCAIHTETFNTNRVSNNRNDNKNPVKVHFVKSNKTFEWDNDYKNLLEFAESNDISLEAGCLFGECGACSTRLADGSVEYNYETATKPSGGNCLPCSCYPTSDIRLDA